jgi:cellulose synthase/poly-beta-1,6-N-acetylglucosamine synthase-like glycosyltransferase
VPLAPRPSARLGRAPLSARVPHPQATLTVADPPRSRRRLWRERPFHSVARSWGIGLLSLAAIALLTLYLTVPAPNLACTAGTCVPNERLTLAYSVITAVTFVITFYFIGLYLIGLTRKRRLVQRKEATADDPFYVLVTPAHNEALVIRETVRCMLRLRGRFLMMVVNDGSTDGTGEIARRAGASDERLIVIDRAPEIAGQGKGEVLNTAYREIRQMVDSGDPRLGGAADEDVILCVLDADGWLRGDALEAVAPYFEDLQVAAVQVPVRMYNARRGFLACMQDIEFIGFSVLIQGGRDRLGSALLGGNGQFVRLAALRSLGDAPWTRALTEDLDIGLRLARAGWVNRVCVETCVAQQAVTHPRALLRQRTRWVQGHYSCWSHLPALWRARNVRFSTRLDLSLHLLLATTILIVTAQATLGVAGFFGLVSLGPIPLATLVGSDAVYRLFVLAAACGPLGMLGVAYQRAAVDYQASLRRRLPLWSLPGVYLLFTLYVYFWGLPSTFRAFGRIASRRDSWAKTARDPLSPAEIDSGTRAVTA